MLSTDAATAQAAPPISPEATPLDQLLRVVAPEVDQRQQARVAAPYLFTMTPLEDLGRGRPGRETGQAISVVGKDINRQGIGFYHESALTYRYVRLRSQDPKLGAFKIDVQLNRCRFTKLGWYESGGRILRVSA